MLTTVAEFAKYFDRLRARTLTYVEAVPPEHADWAPRPGEYTCGDIVRHLAAVEVMDVDAALGAGWHYAGHERDLAPDWPSARARLDRLHAQALARLAALPDADLRAKRLDLAGRPVTAWRILMAMAEHEIHHRSQLAGYLSALDIRPPQLFGVGVETLPRD